VANLKGPIDEQLFAIAQEHLAKLADYVPGPVRKKGTRPKLLRAYKNDPVFSIFGLDSAEYLGATLAGGTVTSIHRKIGDIYEACVRSIFMQTLNLSATDVTYTAIIRSGDEEEQRSADSFIQFEKAACPILFSSRRLL
jgi:hypothetical protein